MFQGNTILAGIEYIYLYLTVLSADVVFSIYFFQQQQICIEKNLHPMCGCDGNRIGKLGFFDQR